MPKRKNIFLIGMMGSGKTTISSALCKVMRGFERIDLDEEIEKTANMTIPQIFKEKGENHFRTLETSVLENVCKKDSQIAATGGGIVERVQNLDLMKKSGTIFYLKADEKILFERVKKNTTRPMLFHENPEKRFKDLLIKREPEYLKADFVIETESKTIDEIVLEIARKYEKNT